MNRLRSVTQHVQILPLSGYRSSFNFPRFHAAFYRHMSTSTVCCMYVVCLCVYSARCSNTSTTCFPRYCALTILFHLPSDFCSISSTMPRLAAASPTRKLSTRGRATGWSLDSPHSCRPGGSLGVFCRLQFANAYHCDMTSKDAFVIR